MSNLRKALSKRCNSSSVKVDCLPLVAEEVVGGNVDVRYHGNQGTEGGLHKPTYTNTVLVRNIAIKCQGCWQEEEQECGVLGIAKRQQSLLHCSKVLHGLVHMPACQVKPDKKVQGRN